MLVYKRRGVILRIANPKILLVDKMLKVNAGLNLGISSDLGIATHTHTDSHNHFTALWILSRTTWLSQYQKKHSPTYIYHGHQSSLICFFHLLQSIASSLFNPHTWQSFSTVSVHVFFGLPLQRCQPSRFRREAPVFTPEIRHPVLAVKLPFFTQRPTFTYLTSLDCLQT